MGKLMVASKKVLHPGTPYRVTVKAHSLQTGMRPPFHIGPLGGGGSDLQGIMGKVNQLSDQKTAAGFTGCGQSQSTELLQPID
jgi:hypothetical protein